MKKKAFIILNPIAGACKGKKEMKRLMPALNAWSGGNYEVLETTCRGDAIRLSHEAVEKGGSLIIVIGGDGTINEVVNGIRATKEMSLSDCELGIINGGSGAGMVQSLGLPTSTRDQLELIFKRPAKPLDVGIVKCLDEKGRPIERCFANECQMGIGGAIVSTVGMAQKRLGGTLAFGMAALSHLSRYEATQMLTRVDTRPLRSQKLLGIVVGNGNYCAGGMQLTPGARPHDGILDVLFIPDMNLANRLINFSKVYSGSHIHSSVFFIQKAKKIKIDSESPVWIETDGELIGKTPCEVSIIPDAIKVRY